MSHNRRSDFSPLKVSDDGDTMMVASYLMDYVVESPSDIDAMSLTIQQLLNDLVGSLDRSPSYRSPVADEIEARLNTLTGVSE